MTPVDEIRFSEVVAHATVGIALVGMDGRWMSLNRAMCRLVGYEEKELKGQHFQGITHEDDRYKDASFVEKLLSGESDGYRVEKRYVHRDGRVVWTEVVASRIRARGTDYCVFISHDIGSRREMEQALHRSEDSFRAIIEGAPDAICVHVSGVIRYVNVAFARALNRPRTDDFVGRPILELFAADDRIRVAESIQTRVTERRTYEAHLLKREGQTVFFEVSEIPVTLEGDPARLLFLRDLTEREASFRKLVRSDRLSAMGILAAGIAHEINNPLAVVVANLDLALEQLDAARDGTVSTTEIAEMMREAREGAHRVRNVVRNMRLLSSLDAIQGEPVLVDVEAALEAALALLWNQLIHRAVLSKEVEPVPRVKARPEELEQLFLNVLMHAARATLGEEGLVAITVRVRYVSDRVMIEVLDSHAPLSADMREHLFDPFYTSHSGGDAGLVLAVGHSIVTQLGGEIASESSSSGNLLRVLLPAGEPHAVARPSEVPQSESLPRAARSGGTRRAAATTTRAPKKKR